MPLHQVSPASSCLWSDPDLLLNLPRDSAIAENRNKHHRRITVVYDDSPPIELVEGTRKLVEWRELAKPLPRSTSERKPTVERDSAPRHSPSSTSIPASNTAERTSVSRSDLERCRHVLRTIFRQCNNIEFRAVCCAISCVMNASKPLRQNELLAAITIHGHKCAQQDLARDRQKPDSQQWLRKCDDLLVEDYNRKIRFRPKAMSFFLRNFTIQGIDTSHKTIATICLMQRTLREESSQASTKECSEILQAADVFSSYAEEFGDIHLRTASLKSLTVTRIVRDDVGKFVSNPHLTLDSETPSDAQERPLAAGCGQRTRSSEDSQEWVLIDKFSPGAADF